MEKDYTKEQRYIFAKNKVEKISKFYKHLSVYIVVNLFLSAFFVIKDVQDGDTLSEAILNFGNFKILFYWGIAIVINAINVFGFNIFFGKDWEDRKIKEYMNQQKNNR